MAPRGAALVPPNASGRQQGHGRQEGRSWTASCAAAGAGAGKLGVLGLHCRRPVLHCRRHCGVGVFAWKPAQFDVRVRRVRPRHRVHSRRYLPAVQEDQTQASRPLPSPATGSCRSPATVSCRQLRTRTAATTPMLFVGYIGVGSWFSRKYWSCSHIHRSPDEALVCARDQLNNGSWDGRVTHGG